MSGSGLPADKDHEDEDDKNEMSDVDDKAASLPLPSVAPGFRVVAPAAVPVVMRKTQGEGAQGHAREETEI